MPRDDRRVSACLLGLVLVVAACGGSAASPTPGAVIPGGSGALSAGASPRVIHGDATLVGQFPTQVAGQDLEVQSLTGRDLIALGDPADPATQAAQQALQSYLADKGKTLDQLGYVFANIDADSGDTATLYAARIAGIDAKDLETGMIPLLTEGYSDLRKSPVDVAGKATSRLSDGVFDPKQGGVYLYPMGDILWAVDGTDPLLTQVFQALP